jgi:5-methylcytosine-specific restriction endonuclease McrA
MPNDPFYTSAAWRTLRRAFITAHPVCSTPGCGVRTSHVDHKVSRRRGGASLDPANLKAFCHSCHSVKTARSDGGFGNRTRAVEPVRATGCDAAGWPRDPTHHWHAVKP